MARTELGLGAGGSTTNGFVELVGHLVDPPDGAAARSASRNGYPARVLRRGSTQSYTRLTALRESYKRFEDGDLEGALALWTDDFVWEGPDSPELPGAGRHEGKQAAIEAIQQSVGAYDTFKQSADEFIEQGDTVVVLGHTDLAKGERSSRTPFVHIWRLRGNGEICRLQILFDTLQAARVLGVV
jgi:ketosteroid isomerase-like protein